MKANLVLLETWTGLAYVGLVCACAIKQMQGGPGQARYLPIQPAGDLIATFHAPQPGYCRALFARHL